MNIVISGFYGVGNTGDEAILEAIIDNLRKELEGSNITVFSVSPQKTAKIHNVKSIYRGWRRQNIEKIRALRQADLLISGGGGLLQDTYPTKFIFGPLPYYLMIVFLAKICGTNVMFFSQGIGPVTSRWGKLLMRLFANMADFITVRDDYSKDYLKKLQVNRPETIVTADIVFAFQHRIDTACMDSVEIERTDNLVAVSVRPWFNYTDHYEELATTLDHLIDTEKILPVFVPMEGDHDVQASNEVVSKMKNGEMCVILGPNFTPNQYLHFISQCQLTIGLRLHSLIFSSIVAVPHIGISYDKKVENLLKRSGMWDYSFPLEKINSKQLVENCQYVLANRGHFSKMIEENAHLMRQDALKNIKLLKKRFVDDLK